MNYSKEEIEQARKDLEPAQVAMIKAALGDQLLVYSSVTMHSYCYKCNRFNNEENNYCIHCGKRLKPIHLVS